MEGKTPTHFVTKSLKLPIEQFASKNKSYDTLSRMLKGKDYSTTRDLETRRVLIREPTKKSSFIS